MKEGFLDGALRAAILKGPALALSRAAYQPQPMCSGRYTAMPTTMVPRMPRFQK
ncbi:hypothetical protein D3C72_2440240 [compost metagenome]